MNLVIQGKKLTADALQYLIKLTDTSATDLVLLDAHACRLDGARRNSVASDVAAFCAANHLDYAWVPKGLCLRDFGLFITDMDSTLINIECIDEIACLHGVGREVARITASAMRGEIDFRTSLIWRVSLLAGLQKQVLAEVYIQYLRLNPGAEILMARLKAAHIRTALVSGGFTYFTERMHHDLGFDYTWANELEIARGRLTGRLVGPIVDGQAKANHLVATRDALGLPPEKVLCVGDGANDIPMFRAAGFSVAYHAKPALKEVADCCIDHVGLEGILRLFG